VPHPINLVDSTTGGASDTSKAINALIKGVTYYFRLTAVDSAGLESDYSNEVTTTPLTSLVFDVNNRRNMVSVPIRVNNDSVRSVFPTSIPNTAYAYQGGYAAVDTLVNGKGFWLKFNGSQSDSMYGVPDTLDTISVQNGWNMIGSISTPVATTKITSEPGGMITSSFYGYAGGYHPVDTIKPGLGYWVRVNQDGELILSSSPVIAPLARIHIVPGKEDPPRAPEDNVASAPAPIPKEFAMEQNYPNPFNPSTVIHYQLPVESKVTLKIYNVLGQEVATLLEGTQQAGYRSVEWDAGNLSSGIYIYQMSYVDQQHHSAYARKKMVLVK